jgi:heme-degrading monooxygenase HmoA
VARVSGQLFEFNRLEHAGKETVVQTTIDDKANVLTLINTFKVHDGLAAQVVESLRKFTEEQAGGMRGFVGSSVHVSLDGTTVVNYVQWKTRDAFDAMFESPAAKEHMRELNAFVVSVSPVFYDVVYVGKASS